MYPSEYLYTEEHEWLLVEGDVCTLGITDYAQSELGDVVYFDPPEVGETFDAGETLGAIDSSKTSADIFTPVSGEVIEINEALDEAPEKVNEDPHGEGWLVKVRMSSKDPLESLMSAEKYQSFVDEQ